MYKSAAAVTRNQTSKMSLGIYGLLLAAALAGSTAAAEVSDDLPLLSKIAYHYDDYIHSLDRDNVIASR